MYSKFCVNMVSLYLSFLRQEKSNVPPKMFITIQGNHMMLNLISTAMLRKCQESLIWSLNRDCLGNICNIFTGFDHIPMSYLIPYHTIIQRNLGQSKRILS